jgi:hypothetical protein
MQRAERFLLAAVLIIVSTCGSADDAKKGAASLVGIWKVQGVAIQGIGRGVTLTIESERGNAFEGVLTLSTIGGMGVGMKITGRSDIAGGFTMNGSGPTLLSNDRLSETARFSFDGKRRGLKIAGVSGVVIDSSYWGLERRPVQHTVFEKSAELTRRYFEDLEKQKKMEEEQRQTQQLVQERVTQIAAVMNAFQSAISAGDYVKASEFAVDLGCGSTGCSPSRWVREASEGNRHAKQILSGVYVPEILGIRPPSPTEVEWVLKTNDGEYRMVSVDVKAVGEIRFAYVDNNWKITNQWW